MFTTILMDADDTIFDFPKCEYAALKNTLKQFGLYFSSDIYNSFSKINNTLWKKLERNEVTASELRVRRFEELANKHFIDFVEPKLLADAYISQLSEQTVLIKGAYDAVKKISEHYDIYIITNGLSVVQRKRFERSDINVFIKKLYISDEIGIQKPQKGYFEYVLNDIPEKDKMRILVVGDSLTSDMLGGKNIGLKTCLYDPKNKINLPNPLCDYKVSELSDIFLIDL